MDTSRDDVSIAIRSAFLQKGAQQRFSLVVLVLVCIIFLFVETFESKPLNYLRSIVKDIIYRGSVVVSTPAKFFDNSFKGVQHHLNLNENYEELKLENDKLKSKVSSHEFLMMENTQLRKLIDEQVVSDFDLVSARVLIDKKSPYLNSFIINIGKNKSILNGMSVLDGQNFIGRTVDVNFFSSRVLLITDLNSKIPVIIEPSGQHAILSGRNDKLPSLEYLPENYRIESGDKVYTSGKEGIFSPGIPIGEVKIENGKKNVLLFSNLDQITFVNVNLNYQENNN
tara:strand:+ start:141 stop:989 length:849 start_codon:yes stop_codon:yes gene_type:complete